jgi:glycosidase
MSHRSLWSRALVALCVALGAVAQAEPVTSVPAQTALEHVPWSRNAVIYELNVRQYTAEGTLKAVIPQLPAIRALGVDILWVMPIQPIGVKERKGTLGSYYSVRDYTAVNPEFGSLTDFKALVEAAHGLGMKVILDWVANHSALDHPWVSEHPDWYQKDKQGQISGYHYVGDDGSEENWSDVAGLDYRSSALRAAMIDAMRFWVQDVGLDGFRCDVAMRVPEDFWYDARTQLGRIKPLFWLAEAETPALMQRSFDMGYAWELGNAFTAIGRGRQSAASLGALLTHPPKPFPADAYHMLFVSNHDFNSWHGSDVELYGPFVDALTVLTYTLPGMPLIYSGQEAVNTRRLEFFERDPIRFKDRSRALLYTRLSAFKHAHPALAAGSAGGELQIIETHHDDLFAFKRVKGRDTVTVVVNLSYHREAVPSAEGLGGGTLPPGGWRVRSTGAPL